MRKISVLLLLTALAGCGAPNGQYAATGNSNIRVADAALASGSPTVALEVAENILKSDPQNVDALVRQGRAHLMLGNGPAAEVTFRKVLTIDPRHVEARTGLAKVQMKTNPAEAERLFTELLRTDPKNAALLNNIGIVYDLQGRHADAQTAYNKALEQNPGLASARQNLALSLAVSGRAQEGVGMLHRLADAGQGGRQLRDNLALALTLAGNTDAAGQVLREGMSQADAARAIAGFRALQSNP